MKQRIIFMGTPEFAVPSLEALIHGDYQVVAVYTQPDRRAGRGQQVTSSPVKRLALSQGLDVVQIDKFKVAGMDTGPILNQREVPITDEDTTGSLGIKLAQVGAQLLTETLPLWIEGRIKPRPQNDSEASYSKMIKKEDGEIDWRLSAKELGWRVRAF